ncbi:hypothetical protein T10_6232 [Trichinella papuae]|uniref:Uncharacterized protein n=1 Tax=Trichinella papuae TaxID=268474 RepID=A0A0V1M8V2_9BILA|nr:hypothetical protein T10_6232 [Trichinella papuae]
MENEGKLSCRKQRNIGIDSDISADTSLKCREFIAYRNACMVVQFQESFRLAAFLCIKIGMVPNFRRYLFHKYELVCDLEISENYNEPDRTFHNSVFVEIMAKTLNHYAILVEVEET